LDNDNYAKTIDNGSEVHTLLPFFSTFAKLKKVSVRSIVSVCPSIYLRATTRLPLDGV